MRVYPERRVLPADLSGPRQQVFANARAVVSLRGFAADPGGLSFIADIRTEDLGHDEAEFAFHETSQPGADACSIRASCASPAGWEPPAHCHLQSGGGGTTDGLGRWTFLLRVPLPRGDRLPGVRVLVQWERMALAEVFFDVGSDAITEAAGRSLAITDSPAC